MKSKTVISKTYLFDKIIIGHFQTYQSTICEIHCKVILQQNAILRSGEQGHYHRFNLEIKAIFSQKCTCKTLHHCVIHLQVLKW
jgi:hypothetical protein